MSRRLRRDLHKRVSSAGYQKIAGDLEVTGQIIGPSIANIVTAIQKIVGGTTSPVQLTIIRCEGIYRGAVVGWLPQYNLMNFDHFEIQGSIDETDWYSLEFDGTDWKDTLNAWTETAAPMVIHPNIPLGGDADAPVGLALYYRVRQATILGDKSEWSASASTTTKTVQAGDLAANIIYANNVIAAEFEALFARVAYSLTIGYSGTGTYDDPDAGDRQIFIDDDEFAIRKHSGAAWIDRIRLGYQVMKAYDENAVVIHDIPDTAILADMIYGGHIIWKDAPDYVDSISDLINDDATFLSHTFAANKSNVDISALVGGLTNVKGAVVGITVSGQMAASKTQNTTYFETWAAYSVEYDTAPSIYNTFAGFNNYFNAAEPNTWIQIHRSQAVIPVVYDGDTPYITWSLQAQFGNMPAVAGVYLYYAYLYLVGVFV